MSSNNDVGRDGAGRGSYSQGVVNTPPDPNYPGPVHFHMAPGMAPPPPPAPTSAAATASLVLAILGSMCLGPVGGIAAIIVGAVALWDIHSSKGRKSGKAMAWVGVGIGSFTTAAFAALVLLLVYSSSSSPSAPPPVVAAPPPIYVPPTAAPIPTTPPPAHGVTMTREMETTETRIGNVVIADVGLGELSLDAALRKQRSAAQRESQTMIVHTTSADCRPCQGVAAALSDPRMQKALEGVRLVRIDVEDFNRELAELGIPFDVIPGFYVLRPDLSPSDGVHGGEWDDDTAENIAPVVHAFVRGKYDGRRHPFKAPAAAKPRGTIL